MNNSRKQQNQRVLSSNRYTNNSLTNKQYAIDEFAYYLKQNIFAKFTTKNPWHIEKIRK